MNADEYVQPIHTDQMTLANNNSKEDNADMPPLFPCDHSGSIQVFVENVESTDNICR